MQPSYLGEFDLHIVCVHRVCMLWASQCSLVSAQMRLDAFCSALSSHMSAAPSTSPIASLPPPPSYPPTTQHTCALMISCRDAWCACGRSGHRGMTLQEQQALMAASQKRVEAAHGSFMPGAGSDPRVRKLPLGLDRHGNCYWQLSCAELLSGGQACACACACVVSGWAVLCACECGLQGGGWWWGWKR